MIDLEKELRGLLHELEGANLFYALAGGLALAVHGMPRATVDIDLIVDPAQTDQVVEIARRCGFTLDAAPMTFADGQLRIRRVSKVDRRSEDVLPLDLLSYSQRIHDRISIGRVDWDGLAISVVTRESLVMLKKLRGSLQDEADIDRLGKDEG